MTPTSMQEAIALLSRLSQVNLSECRVVGRYVRADPKVVADLRTHVRELEDRLGGVARVRANYLVWASPGSGKTFLYDELATQRADSVTYIPVDLKRGEVTQDGLARALSACRTTTGRCLCRVDEIDSKLGEQWPFAVLSDLLDVNVLLDPPLPEAMPNRVFVLIGSTPQSLGDMESAMRGAKKGGDILDRLSARFVIPALTMHDRVVIAVSWAVAQAKQGKRTLAQIERLALLYLIAGPHGGRVRLAKDLVVDAVSRMALTDEYLAYADLFTKEQTREAIRFLAGVEGEAAKRLQNVYLGVVA